MLKSSPSSTTTWWALAAFALGLVITIARSEPPEPLAPDSGDRFSALAAAEILEQIYSDRVSHPTGTANNRAYKERILGYLATLGYEPTVQREFVCHPSGSCGHVENILARLEGTGSGKAVLLAVHYDSVGAGPSVSDDGVAVAATLEIARQLKEGPAPANDVIFLIDDGEEVALLGAVAFSERHPWARAVGAVVNLEARGTGGVSYMFETGTDNAWLVDLMDRNVPRPASSSLFYSVYQRLPNDTDFTIFKQNGMNGVNFAFIRDVVHYHTPLDNLDHYSRATLQHQGDNALAMVRGLAGADLESPPHGTASWFDLWGWDLVSWPEPWNLPLAVIALVLVTIATGIEILRARPQAQQLAWGQLAFPIAVFGSTALALAVAWIFAGFGKLPAWPISAWAYKSTFWLIGLVVPALALVAFGPRTSRRAAWLGALEWMGILAAFFSVLLPGASYLFLVPALLGAVTTLVSVASNSRWLERLAAFTTVFAAGAVQLILAWSLWEAMGITIMPIVSLFIATEFTLVLIPATAGFGRRSQRIPVMGLILVILMTTLGLVLPPYGVESPRPINIYFVQDANRDTAKLALNPGRRPIPEAMADAITWSAESEPFYPWREDTLGWPSADVEPLSVEAPILEILEEVPMPSGRRVVARWLSPRGADRAALVLLDPSRITALQIDGWSFDLDSAIEGQKTERLAITSATIPDEGIELRLEIEGTEPIEVTLFDYDYGLPSAAEPLVEARPDDVVPIDRGDETVVHASASL